MADLLPPVERLLAAEEPRLEVQRIIDLFRVPERYLRSVHLERDFDATDALWQYIITPPLVRLISRITEGLRLGSARRAWRITGDYGTGKSSFALVLAHLLRDPDAPDVQRVRRAIKKEIGYDVFDETAVHMVPVLVTGAREEFVPAVLRGVCDVVNRMRVRTSGDPVLEELYSRAEQVAAQGDASQLLELLDRLGNYAIQSGRSGVLLVLDELGKFLEYASLNPDREDVYLLQRLAEVAARRGDYQFVVVGLLHQGFHAYAERLPSTTRLEWEKVAGRYEEILFDQPLAHVADLVAGTLNVNTIGLPEDVVTGARDVGTATLATGWYGTSGNGLAPLNSYPLHPTVLPVLVRFFARFGQHERSLFSFLLSSEPFGLQSFAERPVSRAAWYRLSDFYDYVRSVFGHRLAGASYRSHWLRISETLDRVSGIDSLELRVLKTVAVLNVVDAEHLLATNAALAAATADGDPEGLVDAAIASLRRLGLLFYRGAAGGYCLWPSTSVNVESTFEAAQRALGPVDRVSAHLRPYLDVSPLVARRHYIETGTLRHFEVRYTEPLALTEVLSRPTDADGMVVVTLCDSQEERQSVIGQLTANQATYRPEVLVAVSPPLKGLQAEIEDAQCWRWVAENTLELAQDSYAMAEVARQVAASRHALQRKLGALFGFRAEGTKVEWWRGGKRFVLTARGRLSAVLSTICDEVYREAPLIRNELLNRRMLSSAAAAARLRLIERMFSAADRPDLGIEPGKAPPEKSMYLSVLNAGHVHREAGGRFALLEPPAESDPLRLRPALVKIMTVLERANGHRVPVPEIWQLLEAPPYGVRAGVVPLLLAIVATAHAHELAVYEQGTFLLRFGTAEFLRLIKRPVAFDFQLSRVVGVRAAVFAQLVRVFAGEYPADRDPQLLDVVRPLSVFAAQIPDYSRNTPRLTEAARGVRDALLTAREPATLIFTTLPQACGFTPFSADEPTDFEQAARFVDALRAALSELRATYPQLLERIRRRLIHGLADGDNPDRARLGTRAARIGLAAREPRLQTFARGLSDMTLSDDAWAEKIGSFVVSKPPAHWTTGDETWAMDELDALSAKFRRVEAASFTGFVDEPNVATMRVLLTHGDGTEEAQILSIRAEDEARIQKLAARLATVLDDSGALGMAALVRVLRSSLSSFPSDH